MKWFRKVLIVNLVCCAFLKFAVKVLFTMIFAFRVYDAINTRNHMTYVQWECSRFADIILEFSILFVLLVSELFTSCIMSSNRDWGPRKKQIHKWESVDQNVGKSWSNRCARKTYSAKLDRSAMLTTLWKTALFKSVFDFSVVSGGNYK